MSNFIITKRVLIGHKRDWRTLWIKKHPIYTTVRYNYNAEKGHIS